MKVLKNTMSAMVLAGVLLFFMLLIASTSLGAEQSVPDYLNGISVTVKANRGQGSGTLICQEDPDTGEVVAFILTAGHVVDTHRSARQVVLPDGKSRWLVEFSDPEIVAERYQDGRRVGQQTLDCRVLKYSGNTYGHDLAVLEVRLRNAYPIEATAKFPDDGFIPPMGTNLSHCGSLLGQFGSNSYTTGVLSKTGRLLDDSSANNLVFDQVTAIAFPGSSGGGMYLTENGVYVGMLTRGVMQMQGFNFIVPIRRIQQWAAVAGVEWLFDNDPAMPSADEILQIPVEEVGEIPSGGSSWGPGHALRLMEFNDLPN